MSAKESLRLVVGSVAVYAIVAACGATNGGDVNGADAGTPSDATHGSVVDALTDPVPNASADVNQSGTRLKVQNYVGADGSKAFMGMYDSMLNVNCAFETAADGTIRCLPPGAGNSGLFADSACMQSLLEVPTGCTAVYGILTTPNTACAPPLIHVFAVGSSFSGTAYTKSGSACTMYPPSALSVLEMTEALYTTGAEVPPSTFVQVTVQTDP